MNSGAALRCCVCGEIECEQHDPGHFDGDGAPEQLALPFAEPAAAALEHQRAGAVHRACHRDGKRGVGDDPDRLIDGHLLCERADDRGGRPGDDAGAKRP